MKRPQQKIEHECHELPECHEWNPNPDKPEPNKDIKERLTQRRQARNEGPYHLN